MKTILHIVGNRPQFIKLAVLHAALARDKTITQKIIHTGQHFSFNMSDLFFEELNIPMPDINFQIQNTSPNLFIGEAIEKLQQYFLLQKECIVLVYGDTNTTLAAAMAAARMNLPLVHIEAGVRTYDNAMPEEINRILTDRLATVNYCCTKHNFENMQQEGYGTAIATELKLTGDLMLDAFMRINASTKKIIHHNEYVVSTIHRDANIGSKQNVENIVNALNTLHKVVPIIMPMHPHTQKKMAEYRIEPKFKILPALGYSDMKLLLTNCKYVITDSGGTSREAYFLQKKSLVIMDKPFWPEILQQSCAKNVLANEQQIIEKFNQLASLNSNFNTNIFGNGNAAENIHAHLSTYLSGLK